MEQVTFDAEITKNPQFEEQLKGIISELEKKYLEAREAATKHGRKLKSSPLITMITERKLTYGFIMQEFPKVAEKKSTMPASQREIIASLVFNAAQRTAIMEQAERARRIEQKANGQAGKEEAESHDVG